MSGKTHFSRPDNRRGGHDDEALREQSCGHLMAERAAPGIAHVIARYPPSLGGAEKVAQSLADRRRDGEATQVLTSRDGREAAGAEDDGFVRRLRALDVANTRIIPGLLGAILRLPRGTVIHLHINSAFVPEIVYAAHLLTRKKYIAHLHFDIATSSCWAGFVLRRIWMPVVLARVLRAAAAVVVFTAEQRQHIASRYGVESARIAVIRNGVDDAFFSDGDRSLRARPRLLFVGRLALEKNLPVLLEALAGVSGRFETVLVGEGPLELELKRKTASLGLRHVSFNGPATGKDLQNLYRTADVLVLPSKSEGMSLVLLEAMAMGLPVVATDLASNRAVIVDGENGLLVAPDDPGALRAALLEVVEDPDTYQRMSRTARKLAEHYRWAALDNDYERLYALARG